MLDELIRDVRRGEGRSLVLRGEAEIGKTALMQRALNDFRDAELSVEQGLGITSRRELPSALPVSETSVVAP